MQLLIEVSVSGSKMWVSWELYFIILVTWLLAERLAIDKCLNKKVIFHIVGLLTFDWKLQVWITQLSSLKYNHKADLLL